MIRLNAAQIAALCALKDVAGQITLYGLGDGDGLIVSAGTRAWRIDGQGATSRIGE